MPRTYRPIATAVCLTLAAVLILPAPALAQARANASAPRSASAAKRTAWTLIGAGLGFGAGMLLGLQKFDDAVYAERKIMTTALIGAAIGGVAGNVLSKDGQPSFAPKEQPAFDGPIVAPRLRQQGLDQPLRDRVSAANRREFSVGDFAPLKTARKGDDLWEGMAAGAVIGAVVGGILVPATSCNTKTNPECPVIVGLTVGIPATAAGAAIGALIDKLR